MANGLLGIGTSGLLAYQRAMATIGHNISNANTPGYSRQRLDLGTRYPEWVAAGFQGRGVDTLTVRRVYDDFVSGQLRSHTVANSEMQFFHGLSSAVDNLLADSEGGLGGALQSFFAALQDVADDPGSLAARQAFYRQSGTLTDRFQYLSRRFDDLRTDINGQLRTDVTEINALAGSIAKLNGEIVSEISRSSGQVPNDLMDQRDALVLQLAEYVQVSTVEQDDGALSVFVGKGQAMVLGEQASQLSVQSGRPDPAQLEIVLTTDSGAGTPITAALSGGKLGGILNFRAQVLDPAQNEFGRIAVSLGTAFNQQQRMGVDLDGALGREFFAVPAPTVLPSAANSGSVTVAFADVSELDTADYRLRFDGSVWSLTRVGDGQAVSLSGSGTAADPFVAEGLSIVVGPGAAAGDNYLIQPTRNAAGGLKMALSSAREIAAAAPILAAAGVANRGTGAITPGMVTDIDNPAFQAPPGQLTPPLLVRFTGPNSYEIVDQSTMTVLDTGSYDPAQGKDLFPSDNLGLDFGYRARIDGAPAAGDEFSITFNSGGVGDNRNALLLAELQTRPLMNRGTTGLTQAYGELVAGVGATTKQAEINAATQQFSLDQAWASREAVSGVNLDEEAAELVRFQQAYQAAAQVVAAADQMFQALLGAVRR